MSIQQHNTRVDYLDVDETSKEDFKYGSIQVTTEQDQSYLLGYLTWTVFEPHCIMMSLIKEDFKYGSIQVTTEQIITYGIILTWTVEQQNTLHYDETSI